MRRVGSFLVLFSFVLSGLTLSADLRSVKSKISPRLLHFLESERPPHVKVWVYFSDHGEESLAQLEERLAAVVLSERATKRRLYRAGGVSIDEHDLPPLPAYLEALRREGCILEKISKYLNAASVTATAAQIYRVASLPFVKRIERVATFRRALRPAVEPGMYGEGGEEAAPFGPSSQNSFYGPSFKQLDLINVPPLHQVGVHGEGVLVAMLDTGFNLNHVSLTHLDVVAQWDFINNDSITQNQPGDPADQHNHGTYTVSALAGYAPGTLIGPAWAASFILAKTERTNVEIEIEEDDWVRGLEWAESLGADVVSSSLGYYDWYTYADLDGNTAVTTKAADIAASKGVTVVTAAGNEGPLPWPGIIAPSDGDSVIAVGAVDSNGVIVSFSSRGPSYDGRIKPDVVAQGLKVVSASPSDYLGFLRTSGTSLSTPLVAGACALLLEIHPYWGPMDVLNALRSSATRSSFPDNNYGWGIINTHVAALNGSTGVGGAFFEYELTAEGVRLIIHTPGAVGEGMDLLRRRWSDLEDRWEPFQIVVENFMGSPIEPFVYVDGPLASGVYKYRIRLHDDHSVFKDLGESIVVPFGLTLFQSTPNPFSSSASGGTEIRFTIQGSPAQGSTVPLSSYRSVSLLLYDVRGARVTTLLEGLRPPGSYRVIWDGTDRYGRPVSPGVYYYRLVVDGRSLTRKLVVISH